VSARRHAWAERKVLRLGLWVQTCTREGCSAAKRRLEPAGVTVYLSGRTAGWVEKAPPCVGSVAAEQLELGVGGRR
jgi:hypothetical protein